MSRDFPDTVPLGEHRADPPRGLRRYVPNYIPFGQRLLAAVGAMTWLAWALVGVLSGHMFFLVSRSGPLHFSGLPALLFSAAVLASAAAVATIVVDHYDRRDNEQAYQRLKRRLWYGAGILFSLSVIVGLAEHASLLPWTDGGLGLLSGRGLQTLLASDAMAAILRPRRDSLYLWFAWTSGWLFVGAVICKLLGWLSDESDVLQRHPVRSGIMFAILLLPALTSFALAMLADLSVGDVARKWEFDEDEVRAHVAWVHSMLIACAGALLSVLAVALVVLFRRLRLVPPLSDEIARRDRAPK